MPQLDAATYLSQVTWLTLFFIVYYRVGLNYILPSLSGRLKVRSKKVSLAKGSVSGFDSERVSALSGYDNIVGNSCSWRTENINSAQTKADSWRIEETRKTDANEFLVSNQSYLNAISNTLAQRILINTI